MNRAKALGTDAAGAVDCLNQRIRGSRDVVRSGRGMGFPEEYGGERKGRG